MQSFCNSNFFIMPTNLNALIRYKRIDACLTNPYVACTIERLQEVCTEALGEFRGRYSLVSERTIREDIKVLRSEILGFNAPIEVKDGVYYYSDKNYSIFKTPLTEVNLLKDILKMFIEERNNIAVLKIENLLTRISIIVGEPIPFEITEDEIELDNEEPETYTSSLMLPLYDSLKEPTQKSHKPSTYHSYKRITNKEKHIDTLILWSEILAVI